MSKIIFKFDNDDPDDKMDAERFFKSQDMAIFIFELVCNSRKKMYHEIEKVESKEAVVDVVFDHIHSLLEENDINIDNLIR